MARIWGLGHMTQQQLESMLTEEGYSMETPGQFSAEINSARKDHPSARAVGAYVRHADVGKYNFLPAKGNPLARICLDKLRFGA